MVLVANKADLETDRVVSYHEGEELAKTLKVWQLNQWSNKYVLLLLLLG